MPKDRAMISRRLKAARWLAGEARDARGALAPLSAKELATRPQLVANRITTSRIEEIEQERVEARDMELEQIALALGQPRDYFGTVPESGDLSPERLRLAGELLGPQLLAAARAVLQARDSEQQDTDEPDHPPATGEGGGG